VIFDDTIDEMGVSRMKITVVEYSLLTMLLLMLAVITGSAILIATGIIAI